MQYLDFVLKLCYHEQEGLNFIKFNCQVQSSELILPKKLSWELLGD